MFFYSHFFLYYHKIKQKIYVWLLKYKNIKIVYISLFIILFIRSFDIINLANHKNKNILSFLESKSDYEDYYNAAKQIKNKQNPYYKDRLENFFETIPQNTDFEKIIESLKQLKGIGTYLYPPLFAFLLIPLSFFSYNISAIIYQIIQLLLLYFSLYFLYQIPVYMNLKISKRKIHLALILSLLVYFPFQIQNISNGNVGFIIIFLLSLSLYLFFKYKNKILYDFINGILIGIATIIKVLPGFITGLYFIRRRIIILIGMILGTIIGIFLPTLYLGWELNWDFFTTWYQFIIKNYQKYSVIRPYANNQTISGALCKLFIPFADVKQFQYGLPITFITLSLNQVSFLIKLINYFILINVVIITLLLFFKKKDDFIEVIYIYFIFLSALLSSGISWYHTYGLLMIVYFFYFIYKFKFLNKHLKIFVIPVLYIWIFSLLPFRYKDLLSLYSIYTWLNLFILFIIVYKLYYFIFMSNQYEKIKSN
ncbi:MAG: hypothetical protein KatS3mg129_0751 [Leptospiraceae bacterium]|nr:MAG: hypothetical protein KatS3mg129_0751 [Leptospiraceae bacterium]